MSLVLKTTLRNMLIISLAILVLANFQAYALTLPKLYKNEMVLQASPAKAVIWGFLDGNNNEVEIYGDCVLKDGSKSLIKESFMPKQDDDKFQFQVPNGEHSRCSFSIFQEGADDIILDNVIYGDVWVCSGQSNMQWAMNAIFNSSEEIADIANYPNIRMYKVKRMTSDQPQDDLMDEDFTAWAKPNDVANIRSFSAVCLLTAKYFADNLGKDKVFGLIETNWGGTRIEAWMPQEPLDDCDIEPNDDNGQNSNSVLYNAMIHPLIKTTIKGALWYQGEANSKWNRDKYQCTFPAMIQSWRQLWAQNSGTLESFPFGFMQLSTNQANDNWPGFPVVRWHQTSDVGYVPNENAGMNKVFMGVALDTYDEQNGIHPRNKQLVSQRLAYAGLNVAYGKTSIPANGPFPITFEITETEDSGYQIDILYDQDFIWNPDEIEGFYVCCQESVDQCNNMGNGWEVVQEGSVNNQGRSLAMTIPSCSIALAYLWRTTPVLKTANLPIYAADEFRLPGAPWLRTIQKSK